MYLQSYYVYMADILISYQISTAAIGFNIYEYSKAKQLLRGLLAEPERFTDFSYLTFWAGVFRNCAGLSIFLGLVKIFKYISFNKTMSQLAGTLTRVRIGASSLYKSDYFSN